MTLAQNLPPIIALALGAIAWASMAWQHRSLNSGRPRSIAASAAPAAARAASEEAIITATSVHGGFVTSYAAAAEKVRAAKGTYFGGGEVTIAGAEIEAGRIEAKAVAKDD